MEIGAQVCLKSGGPTMTVFMTGEKGWIHCQWFDGNQLLKGGFPPETLVAAKPSESSEV